ncbi:hypothetical protein GALL_213640 [mine drainage metagenome]|uniref:Uncharacterized protein n=1 Tax=mine drainage metagenome TaxID=410659 RepID=A0A1J5S8R4_9ZZZZ
MEITCFGKTRPLALGAAASAMVVSLVGVRYRFRCPAAKRD